MKKPIAVALVFALLSIATVYPTYATYQVMLEYPKASLQAALQAAPNLPEELTAPTEALIQHYQDTMLMLIAVEVTCIAIASVALYKMGY